MSHISDRMENPKQQKTQRSPNGKKLFKPYPKYKDSGVEWLEKIPDEWKTKRLKYTAQLIMGQSPPSEVCNEVGDGTPFLQGNAEFGKDHPVPRLYCPSAAKRAPNGSHLISVRAPVGAVNTADQEYGIGRGLCAVCPMELDLENRFCRYTLEVMRWQLDAVSTGSTYEAVSANEVGNLFCILPSLDEQRRISSFLDRETAKIDALISKRERLIELLQEKRTALISQAVTKGLDPNMPMKDSGVEWLGEIPIYWNLIPLKYCAVKKANAIKTGPFGSQLLSSEMMSGEVKVYNQRTVLDHDFVSGDNYVTEDKFYDLISFMVEPGDILLTTRGTIGRCAIVPKDAEKGVLHPCLMRIQPEISTIVPEYLVLLIQDSILVQTQIRLASNATTIDVIYSETMKDIKIPLPPMQEQLVITAAIDRETSKIDAMIAKTREAIYRLKEYRAALISAAVTGKIDVRGENT